MTGYKKIILLGNISSVMLSSGEDISSQFHSVLSNKQRREDNLLCKYIGEQLIALKEKKNLKSTNANEHFKKNIAMCFDDPPT